MTPQVPACKLMIMRQGFYILIPRPMYSYYNIIYSNLYSYNDVPLQSFWLAIITIMYQFKTNILS